jgi:hypothetical protein
MTHEVSPKTEQQHILATLLRSAQMSLKVPTSDSFTLSLESICKTCSAERADLLRLFSAENPVTVGDFVMGYERERDRIHFAKTKSFDGGAITSFASPVSPAAAPAVIVGATQKADASMSAERVTAIAKQEFATDEKLRREFTSEARYVAWRKAEVSGRARILGRPKTVNG